MKQTRYGLLTALKPTEEITSWTGKQIIKVENAILNRTASGHEIIIKKNSTGKIIVSRSIEGNLKDKTTYLIEENCNITLIEKVVGNGNLQLENNIKIKPNCIVDYQFSQDIDTQSSADIIINSEVKKSEYKLIAGLFGSKNTFADFKTNALTGASVKTHAVIIGNNDQQFDVHTSSIHSGPNGSSDMLVRGALFDRSRALNHGLIRIEKDSAECDTYQKTELLLLSPTAGADAVPNLEIHDHRVRCTHGATIGGIDEEKIFYLQSRGLNPTKARQIITLGFLGDIAPKDWLPLIERRLGFEGEE